MNRFAEDISRRIRQKLVGILDSSRNESYVKFPDSPERPNGHEKRTYHDPNSQLNAFSAKNDQKVTSVPVHESVNPQDTVDVILEHHLAVVESGKLDVGIRGINSCLLMMTRSLIEGRSELLRAVRQGRQISVQARNLLLTLAVLDLEVTPMHGWPPGMRSLQRFARQMVARHIIELGKQLESEQDEVERAELGDDDRTIIRPSRWNR